MEQPLGQNMWILLNPDGELANEATAGMQFALGETEFWRQTELANYEETARPKLTKLNKASLSGTDAGQEIVEIDGHWVYRPKIAVGDLLVFDHHIPHASYVPAKATAPRISCDLRIFPTSDVVNWVG